MIPIRVANPSRRTPWVNFILIGLNVIIFFGELLLGDYNLGIFISNFGFVPQKLFSGILFSHGVFWGIIPFLSCLFLHGGWFHLLGNMLYLWIFGDNIENFLGHFGYLFFYLFCGIFATLTHSVIHPGSDIPIIGASGAIAGVLGAYLVLFPRAKVLTLLPIGIFFHFVELPAYVILFFWFIIQFFQGFASLLSSLGGIAWWAHIGGFIIGIIFALPLKKKLKKRYFYH